MSKFSRSCCIIACMCLSFFINPHSYSRCSARKSVISKTGRIEEGDFSFQRQFRCRVFDCELTGELNGKKKKKNVSVVIYNACRTNATRLWAKRSISFDTSELLMFPRIICGLANAALESFPIRFLLIVCYTYRIHDTSGSFSGDFIRRINICNSTEWRGAWYKSDRCAIVLSLRATFV